MVTGNWSESTPRWFPWPSIPSWSRSDLNSRSVQEWPTLLVLELVEGFLEIPENEQLCFLLLMALLLELSTVTLEGRKPHWDSGRFTCHGESRFNSIRAKTLPVIEGNITLVTADCVVSFFKDRQNVGIFEVLRDCFIFLDCMFQKHSPDLQF